MRTMSLEINTPSADTTIAVATMAKRIVGREIGALL
jgi:hypothetical protein